jgi:hypothetical protein
VASFIVPLFTERIRERDVHYSVCQVWPWEQFAVPVLWLPPVKAHTVHRRLWQRLCSWSARTMIRSRLLSLDPQLQSMKDDQ